MTTPAQPSSAGPPPRARRGIIVGVAAGAVLVAVATGLVLAGLAASGPDRTDRTVGTATSGAAAPGGSSAAASTPASPAPAATPATTPAATPGATSTAAVRVAMPDVMGKNAAAARIELERLGFRTVQFGAQEPGDTVVLPQNWTVTRQSAAAGAQVATDTAIVLTCTRRV